MSEKFTDKENTEEHACPMKLKYATKIWNSKKGLIEEDNNIFSLVKLNCGHSITSDIPSDQFLHYISFPVHKI